MSRILKNSLFALFLPTILEVGTGRSVFFSKGRYRVPTSRKSQANFFKVREKSAN